MKSNNLSDIVSAELEKTILKKLKPGDKLPTEMELAKKFSVGRSTIRESLRVLSSKGLLTRRNKGTFVSASVNKGLADHLNLLINMEIGNVDDLIELREMLELNIITIAAKKATGDTILELERINWQMQEPGVSPETRQQCDIQFHNTIAKATKNTVLMELLNAIRLVIVKNLEDINIAITGSGDSYTIHQKLIKAITEHNPQKAYEVMQQYFKFIKENKFLKKTKADRREKRCGKQPGA
jgi:GntR family transcriptional repressor for pyruvate dehydrogenase complex